ncbi:MAG: ABC transporter permease, partial [Trebonia sp.]
TAMLYMQTSRQAATSQAYGRFLSADLVVSGGADGLPLSASAAASRLPGVAAASPLVTSEGYFDVPPGSNPKDVNAIPLEGLDGADAGQVTDYPVTAGSLRQLTGDSIAICSGCQAPGRDLGDTVSLRFGDNASLRLKIVAVIATPRGFPALFLPANLLAAHTATGLASQILIATTRDADMTALRSDLRALAPGVEVAGREATLAAFSAQQQSTNWVEYLLIAAVIVYAIVSLVSSTVAATRQRRPQLRMLGLIGADRGQVARTVTIEAIMISLAGVVLGTVVALASLLPFDSALGAPGLPAGSIWIYLTITASATVLTIGTARLSAWRRRYRTS